MRSFVCSPGFRYLQLALLLTLAALMRGGAAAASATSRVREGEKLALSLRILQEQLLGTPAGAPYPQELLELKRAHRVYGYVIDPANKDIILILKRFTQPPWDQAPVLHLEHLVIALRNSHKLYLDQQRRYSVPSCSIDPDSKVLSNMARLSEQMRVFRTVGDPRHAALKQQWKSLGEAMQNVSVDGVPFSSHFARVMVVADYEMKEIVDGKAAIGVPGFQSMRTLFERELARGSNPPRSLLNRFWFSTTTVSCRSGSSGSIIEDFNPPLLTEEEFHNQTGRKGAGRSNRFAKVVAETFTTNFHAIAEEKAWVHGDSIYLELENLYRWFAFSELLVKESAFKRAQFDDSYLLRGFRLGSMQVDRQVKGRVNEILLSNGARQYEFLSCGGVELGVRLRKAAPDGQKDRALPGFLSAALQRPNKLAIMWVILSNLDFDERRIDAVGPSKNAPTKNRPDDGVGVLN